MGPLQANAGRVGIVAVAVGLLIVPLTVAEPAVQEAVLADGLNPFILTNVVSRNLAVEIDWVAGEAPTSRAVQALEELLRRHCPQDKRIDVLVDDEIELGQWDVAADRGGFERLVAQHLDHDPALWSETEVVYVLYVPDSYRWYGTDVSGMTDWVVFDRDGRTRTVRTVMLFTDRIRHDAWLWVTPSKIERATLVHEFGHVLGLVGNPRHTQPSHPGHCTRSRCVMHQPGARSRFVNALPAFFAGQVPYRFGRRCVDDIRAAQRLWAAGEPRTDLFAERLRAARAEREASVFSRWRAKREFP